MPHENEIQIVKGNCQNNLTPLDTLSGNNFVISPFDSAQGVYSIPFETTEYFTENENLPFHFLPSNRSVSNIENYYNSIIEKAKQNMKQGLLLKVVLANKKEISTKNFSPLAFYKKIVNEYKNAFVYLISSPITGVWIGASPEPLIISNQLSYKTIALAGTILKNGKFPFSDKEKIEQNIVESFIEQKLENLKIKYLKSSPQPIESGNLLHLKTEFTFDIQTNSEKIIPLLVELNPTPATAGIPRQNAINFIKENEGFNRFLYTGFLGIANNNAMNLFVNLRCMQVSSNSVILYAGAGITQDSNPFAEWQETQNKMKTLEGFL